MTIFNQETFRFLKDLTDNNARDWFEDNRDRYEAVWLEPARAFVESWFPFMADLTPPHKAEARINGSIRRLNRDVRFSKDKRPYDPKMHLVFWCGNHPNRSAGIHVVLHPNKLVLGVGQWAMNAEELAAFRAAIVSEATGAKLTDLISTLEADGFALTEPALKRLPKGLPTDTGRDHLLMRKGLVMTNHDQPMDLSMLDDQRALQDYFQKLAEINRWIAESIS